MKNNSHIEYGSIFIDSSENIFMDYMTIDSNYCRSLNNMGGGIYISESRNISLINSLVNNNYAN